jgi:integrase
VTGATIQCLSHSANPAIEIWSWSSESNTRRRGTSSLHCHCARPAKLLELMQHVGDCKTEASRKPVPLDLRLSKVLWNWRLQSPYPIDEDWVFASPHSRGKLPYWPGSLYKAHLEPAAKEIGIVGHFGWHTFRHTYATLLKGNGEDVKVVQELMRHANISSHPEHLRAGHHANQARCAEPSRELVARQERRKTKHRSLSDVNGRTKFWRGFASG